MNYLVSQQGERHPLSHLPMTIGRAKDNDLILADEAVSGHHARIEQQGSNLVLIDLGSSNGTRVNKQRIEGAHKLNPGDIISFANRHFQIRGVPVPAAEALICPQCGREARPGARFCAGCGASLEEEAAGSDATEMLPGSSGWEIPAGLDATEQLSTGEGWNLPPEEAGDDRTEQLGGNDPWQSAPPPPKPPASDYRPPAEEAWQAPPPYSPPGSDGTPQGQGGFYAPPPAGNYSPPTPPSLPSNYEPAGGGYAPPQKSAGYGASVSPGRVNLSQALGAPFQQAAWVGTLLVGGLIMMIPFIGWIWINGYYVEVVRRVINGDPESLPTWSDMGRKFSDGIGFFFLNLIWLLLASAVTILPAFLIGYVIGDEAAAVLATLASLAMPFLLYLFLPVAVGRYARSGSFGDALNLPEILAMVRRHWGRYLANWLLASLMLVISFALIGLFGAISAATLIFLVGFCGLFFSFILSFYLGIFQFHLMGQLYKVVQ